MMGKQGIVGIFKGTGQAGGMKKSHENPQSK
jgi:hypothetical protein